MEKKRRIQKNILELTLERLRNSVRRVRSALAGSYRLGIKPWWNTVLGSNNECGIAANFSGHSC